MDKSPVQNEAASKAQREAMLVTLGCYLQSITGTCDVLPSNPDLISLFHAETAPQISIRDYFIRICTLCDVSGECAVHAVMYACCAAETLGWSLGAIPLLAVHRLVVVCVVVGAKFVDDFFFDNRHFAKVGGVCVGELNQLESELLRLLDFTLHRTPAKYWSFLRSVVCGPHHEQASACGCPLQTVRQALPPACPLEGLHPGSGVGPGCGPGCSGGDPLPVVSPHRRALLLAAVTRTPHCKRNASNHNGHNGHDGHIQGKANVEEVAGISPLKRCRAKHAACPCVGATVEGDGSSQPQQSQAECQCHSVAISIMDVHVGTPPLRGSSTSSQPAKKMSKTTNTQCEEEKLSLGSSCSSANASLSSSPDHDPCWVSCLPGTFPDKRTSGEDEDDEDDVCAVHGGDPAVRQQHGDGASVLEKELQAAGQGQQESKNGEAKSGGLSPLFRLLREGSAAIQQALTHLSTIS